MKESSSNLNIKFKLILGYSLTILTVIVASFFSYISFTKLLDSVEELTEPDSKLIRLNQIVTDISEAESSTRSYILTQDKSYLENYYEYVASIKTNIDELKVLTQPNLSQYAKVDSLDRLFDEKVESLNTFIDLKKRSRDSDFSSRALRQLTRKSGDSARRTTMLTTTTEVTTIEPLGPLGKEEEKSNGLLDIIKKIFVGKDEPENKEDSVQEVLTKTKVTVDTTITSEYQPDTVLLNVKRMLADLQAQETRFNRLLTNKELAMLKRDNLIMNNIRTIIHSLEAEERALDENKAAEAKSVADTFSKTILIIGIISLIAGIVFIVLILHDVNRSNFYKRQLVRAKSHAEKLARAKEEFLSNMSHEIRTPLNAVIGFSEQLSGTSLNGTQQAYLHAVRTSSDHLLSTVNDILDFQKIEAGKLKIEKIPFRIDTVIQEVYSILKLTADNKGLGFTYVMGEDSRHQTLLGDPFRLKQILFNLVSNAIKFTEEGHVRITCDTQKISGNMLSVAIAVEDTGIGISEEKAQQIFEGFNQADATTTRKFGGTGLGLSISRKLVELQQGEVDLESTPGQGSVFSFKIPYETTDVEVPEISRLGRVDFDTTPLRKKRVLLVDDDAFNITLASVILQKWGMTCDKASSGEEALALIEQNRYDIVLSDLHMPGMSGLDLTRNIRSLESEKSTVPVIALTANVAEKAQRRLKESGVNDLLLKPFKEADLYRLLIKFLKPAGDMESEMLAEAQPEGVPQDQLYSLSDFHTFSGGDEEMFNSMIKTLLEDQGENVHLLNEALNKKDWKAIGDYAHKMIPSFSYLKVEPLITGLREIDNAIKDGNHTEEIIGKGREVVIKVSGILESLAKEMSTDTGQPVKG